MSEWYSHSADELSQIPQMSHTSPQMAQIAQRSDEHTYPMAYCTTPPHLTLDACEAAANAVPADLEQHSSKRSEHSRSASSGPPEPPAKKVKVDGDENDTEDIFHEDHEGESMTSGGPPTLTVRTSPVASTRPKDFPMSPASPTAGQGVTDPVSVLSEEISIQNMVSYFASLPAPLQKYAAFNMLRHCTRSTLSALINEAVPSLRCDFISLLPAELCYNVLSYLDPKALCRASQVSHRWRDIIESSERLWRNHAYVNDSAINYNRLDKATKAEVEQQVAEEERLYNLQGSHDGSLRPYFNLFKHMVRKMTTLRKNWMNPKSKPIRIPMPDHGSRVVTCLQFDDDKIVTGSDDHTINVYDTQTGELRCSLAGHDGGVWALKYVGNTLVSGSTDRTVRVWDIANARCTHIFNGHSSTVRCLDIVEPLPVKDPNSENIIMQPSEPLIVTGSRDSTLRVWKLPKEGDPERLAGSNSPDPFFVRALRGHAHSVRAIAGYGDTIVSGSYDNNVRVWSLSTGLCKFILSGHSQRVYSTVIDHKRNRCISGSMDTTVKVWCLDTGACLYTLDGHRSLIGLLDLNSTALVSAAADSTLRIWDPETGEPLHKLEGHSGAITCFQHDEDKVISGSEKTLKLWDIRTGKPIRDLLDDVESIWQVRFDSRRCVAAIKRAQGACIEVLDFNYDSSKDDSNSDESTAPTGMDADHQEVDRVVPEQRDLEERVAEEALEIIPTQGEEIAAVANDV